MSHRVMGTAGTLLCACVLGCGGSHRSRSTAPSTPTTTVPVHIARAPRRRHRPRVDPGSLPQTHQLPSSHTAAFSGEMDALWRGVRSGRMRPALPAFFPERAYAQVKAIADPAADYRERLLGHYALDLSAAHALGSVAGRARLLRVEVPAAYVHWVEPGACFNRVGYYEVPNSRVVYDAAGQVRSFGIASMISWRGVWYVVHVGAVQPPAGAGVVDAPSSGPGAPQASSTC